MIGRRSARLRACPFREDHDLPTVFRAHFSSCNHLLQRSRIPGPVDRNHRRLQRVPAQKRIPEQLLFQNDRRGRHDKERNEHIQHAIVLASIQHRAARHVLAPPDLHFDSADHPKSEDQSARIYADCPERHGFRQKQCRQEQDAQHGHQAIHPDHEEERAKHHHAGIR